jgi:hypothetical protein
MYKCSLAYNRDDFKDVVNVFVAGESSLCPPRQSESGY